MKNITFTLLLSLLCLMANAQEIQHITKEEFLTKVWNYEKNPNEFVYEGNIPCIVDFYASWCGPCRRLAPILEELQKEYKGKIIIYKVNTEEERELAQAFGIQSIPSLLYCPRKGQPTMTKGLMPKENLVQIIDEILLKKQPKKTEEKPTKSGK